MRILNALKNGVLATLFFTSCSNTCGPQWCCIAQPVFPAEYSSRRIYLPANHGYNQIEVELVQTSCSLRMYLNSHNLPFPESCDDPYSSEVYVAFRSHSYTTKFDRLVGGHRLLVPETVRNEIVDSLLGGHSVYIRVGGFEADLMPNKFAAVYN